MEVAAVQRPAVRNRQTRRRQHPAFAARKALVGGRQQRLCRGIAMLRRHAGGQLRQRRALLLGAGGGSAVRVQAGQGVHLGQVPAATQLPGGCLQQVGSTCQVLHLSGAGGLHAC